LAFPKHQTKMFVLLTKWCLITTRLLKFGTKFMNDIFSQEITEFL
jgi:hypothetical protein